MRHFLICLTLMGLIRGGAQAQESDRVELLRTVLRATVRDGYPWKKPEPSIISLITTGACSSPNCRAFNTTPADTLPETIRDFVRDSLHSQTLTSPERYCTTTADPALIIVGEPSVQRDTAYVGVAWIGCCRDPVLKRCYPADALIELVRRDGNWSIRRLASQRIT
jgi:hypothetical protein